MSQQKRASFLRRFFFGDVIPNLPAENPFAKKETVISGRRLITREEAAEISDMEPGDPGLSFGGIAIGSKTHFIVCGQTQSGKTTVLKQMMAEALLRVRKGSDERAVIFDATGDFIPFIYGVCGDDAPVIILDPEDERGYAWDVSADITTPTQTDTLAEILIPEGQHEEEFFFAGARSVTKAILESFLLRSEEAKEKGEIFHWTLRDLFNAVETKETAREVLRYWTGRGAKDFEHEIKLYVERNNDDILSTIAAKSSKSRLVAAMWDGQPKISIKDFVENTDGKIIVITNSNKTKSVVKELNRLFLESLSQELLDTESLKGKRTHIFLDEFTELGKLNATKDLLKLGLKKGVRVYLCYQNFEEVKEVYGEEQASLILSESGTIAFLRQTGKSAEAAADFIGKQIVRIKNRNWGATMEGGRPSYQGGGSEQQEERWTVGKEALSTDIQPAGPKNGVGGYFFSPSVRDVWFHQFEWRELHQIATVHSTNPGHKPKKPREGINYQFLKKWSDAERPKFGLEIKTPEKKQEVQTTKAAENTAAMTDNSTCFAVKHLENLKRMKEPTNVFEKIKQGRGEVDIDEIDAALKKAGFRYRD